MKIKRTRVSLIKTFLKTLLIGTGTYIFLLVSFFLSLYRDSTHYDIYKNKTGIDLVFIIILVSAIVYILFLLFGPVIQLKKAIWNNSHMSLAPIVVNGSSFDINNSKKKQTIYIKDIKEIKTDDKKRKIYIKYQETHITIYNVDECESVVEYLNSLLHKENFIEQKNY